jgi:hypothetical protein
MKSKYRYLIASSLFLAMFLLSTGLPASSAGVVKADSPQDKKDNKKTQPIELNGQKGTSRSEGADPNIKSDKQTNDPTDKTEAPEAKGGPRSRGGSGCRVQLDNRTRYIIKVYVDGYYRGTMSPYGDSYVYVAPGETKVYARADFDDGSYSYWGPKYYDCDSGQYIYFKMNY